jgi:hypothetical protein
MLIPADRVRDLFKICRVNDTVGALTVCPTVRARASTPRAASHCTRCVRVWLLCTAASFMQPSHRFGGTCKCLCTDRGRGRIAPLCARAVGGVRRARLG